MGSYFDLLGIKVKFPLALRTETVVTLDNLSGSLQFKPVIEN